MRNVNLRRWSQRSEKSRRKNWGSCS